MVSLNTLLYLTILILAILGAFRGWAKEILVTFSAVLGLLLINVLDLMLPNFQITILNQQDGLIFWLRLFIVSLPIALAYQIPNFARMRQSRRFQRQRIQDTILGIFIGALNGYLIFGTFWYIIHEAGYPIPLITAPEAGTTLGDSVLRLVQYLPPYWLESPYIYFVTGISFIFVVMVFL